MSATRKNSRSNNKKKPQPLNMALFKAFYRENGSSSRKKKKKKYKRTKNSNINLKNPSYGVQWQLFTDVDDTLHPAGPGFFGGIAGSNDNGSRHEYYNCVGDLHKQFYTRYNLPTVIVSANPLPVLRSKTRNVKNKLGNIGVKIFKGEWGASTASVVRARFQKTAATAYQAMANTKIKQISEEVTNQRKLLGPSNYKAIWIGDNGQGDFLVAQQLLKDKIIEYAFIHTVVERKDDDEEDDDEENDDDNDEKKNPDGSEIDERIIHFEKNTYKELIKELKTDEKKKFKGDFIWLEECSSVKSSSIGGCLRSVSRSRNRTRRRR